MHDCNCCILYFEGDILVERYYVIPTFQVTKNDDLPGFYLSFTNGSNSTLSVRLGVSTNIAIQHSIQTSTQTHGILCAMLSLMQAKIQSFVNLSSGVDNIMLL